MLSSSLISNLSLILIVNLYFYSLVKISQLIHNKLVKFILLSIASSLANAGLMFVSYSKI